MKKLKLALDALRVQSFETASRRGALGTVRGLADGIFGAETVVIGIEDGAAPAKTDGSCGLPDCKTEPAVCPP
jgi:hypothetical protein